MSGADSETTPAASLDVRPRQQTTKRGAGFTVTPLMRGEKQTINHYLGHEVLFAGGIDMPSFKLNSTDFLLQASHIGTIRSPSTFA